MVYDPKRIITIAETELGYLEKKSNKNLDSKTANAGSNNYTKYARDLDAIGNFYNGKKQGYAWCDVFVDWCFVEAYGLNAAYKLLYQPKKSCGAGCTYSRRYYKNEGQLFSKPKPGDQIFFWSSDKSRVAHTGLVYKVDGSYVYTIEGNTSSASGVVANGGCVRKKKYSLKYGRIAGYGRPDYGTQTEPETPFEPTVYQFGDRILKNGCEGVDVKELQTILISLGYSCGRWGADGEFGDDTEAALVKFQIGHDLNSDGIMNQADFDALREVIDEDTPDDPNESENREPDPEPTPEPDPVDYSGKKIIDISRWNGKIKHINKLKEAVAFVIHRSSCGLEKDAVIDYNAALMCKADIPFGVYHYLKALTIEEAKEEAHMCYQSAVPYSPKVWAVDCEYGEITKAVRKKGAAFAQKIVEAFIEELTTLGVKRNRIGIYIGHHLYTVWKLDYKSYAFIWIPRYGKNKNVILEQYFPAYPCDLHQYTSRGQCAGIADKTIDLNRITGEGKSIQWFIGK